MEEGRGKRENGKWKMEDGRWKMENELMNIFFFTAAIKSKEKGWGWI